MLRFYVLLILLVSLTGACYADGPGLLDYSGQLNNSEGNPVDDSTYAVQFGIYDSPVDNRMLWQSSDYMIINTVNGKFKTTLGLSNPLPDSLRKFDYLWLELDVKNGEDNEARIRLICQGNRLLAAENIESPLSAVRPIVQDDTTNLNPQYISGGYRDKPIKIKSVSHYNKDDFNEFVIRTGLDIGGTHKVSGVGLTGEDGVNVGVSLGIEDYWVAPERAVMVGAGLEFQLPRSMSEYAGSFRFTSAYLLLKFPMLRDYTGSNYLLIGGRAGYNWYYGNSDYRGNLLLEGGSYLGAGLSLLISNTFFLEVTRTINNGSFDFGLPTFHVNYIKTCISLGLKMPQLF